MDFDNMDDNTREFFNLIINALYSKFNKKEDIQDFILSLSNRIEENDYQDVDMDEDYEITITDGLQARSDARDDDDDEDVVEEDIEVQVDENGFFSLK
tara:strand:+ start:431 stop:724 length:294 start_codon:yes stop_codon:yes gene_type:complete